MSEANRGAVFSRLLSFASQKKRYYIVSVALAILGAICRMLPFLVVAHIVQQLFNGEENFESYIFECMMMASKLLGTDCSGGCRTFSEYALFGFS